MRVYYPFFAYKSLIWRLCITCMQYPETSMKNHGYLLPPTGPNDGLPAGSR